jgi:hypothetical protein
MLTDEQIREVAEEICEINRREFGMTQLCCFTASSGLSIMITQCAAFRGFPERLQLSCEGEFSLQDIAEAEAFITDQMGLRLGGTRNCLSFGYSSDKKETSYLYYSDPPIVPRKRRGSGDVFGLRFVLKKP